MFFKRFWLLVAAVICTSAAFISCSDNEPGNDEGQNGGNTGIGNGGTGVEVLPKKIKAIKYKSLGRHEYSYWYSFFYDEENRLNKIYHSSYEGEVDTIVYEKDSINVKEIIRGDLEDEYGIKLKNGKAVKSYETDNLIYEYSDNGYLSEIRCPSERYTQELTTTDGILTSIYVPQDDETHTFIPDLEAENNTNVDLYGFEFIYNQLGDNYAILLCATGKRIKYLPKKCDNTEYTYEINPEGYITKITRDLGKAGKDTFEIFYED